MVIYYWIFIAFQDAIFQMTPNWVFNKDQQKFVTNYVMNIFIDLPQRCDIALIPLQASIDGIIDTRYLVV